MAKLAENAVKLIYEICDRYRDEKTPLMMILSDIQNEYGYIPLEVQEIVSRQTGISVAEIYGVVTFLVVPGSTYRRRSTTLPPRMSFFTISSTSSIFTRR